MTVLHDVGAPPAPNGARAANSEPNSAKWCDVPAMPPSYRVGGGENCPQEVIAMVGATSGEAFRHLSDIFGNGSVVGLGDGQLLARYSDSKDEVAFEALVPRHGPMVLATCRAILKNEHDVEDAFQATFLVLARKAGSIRVGDALGGWLHRVAYRASVQASMEAKRRRRKEAEASAMAPSDASHPGLDADPDWSTHPARGDRPPARRPAPPGRALRPGGADLRAGGRAAPLDRADAPLPAGEGPAAAQRPPDPPGVHRPRRSCACSPSVSEGGLGDRPAGADPVDGRSRRPAARPRPGRRS